MTHRALYYPYMRFQDETWLKAAALYWDQVGRIVPYDGYDTDDSETVRLLRDADVVAEFASMGNEAQVGTAFHDLVERWKDPLRARFSIDRADPEQQGMAAFATPSRPTATLAYVHVGKVAPELRDLLIRENLASGDDNDAWLGMHPRLVAVYMTALAQVMAVSRGARPLTNDVLDHVAVAGLDLGWIAHSLLPEAEVAPPAAHERDVETVMVSLAIESVLPAGLSKLPANEILHLRSENAPGRVALQAGIAEMVARISHLDAPLSTRDLDWIIRNEHAKHVSPAIDELTEELRDNRWRTVRSLINIQTTLPATVAFGLDLVGLAATAPAGVAAVAWSAWSAIGDGRAQARQIRQGSRVSYLLAIKAAGGTPGLSTKVRRAVRKVQARPRAQ